MKLEFMQACHYQFVETVDNQYQQHLDIIKALYDRNSPELIRLLSNHEKRFHTLNDHDFSVISHIEAL